MNLRCNDKFGKAGRAVDTPAVCAHDWVAIARPSRQTIAISIVVPAQPGHDDQLCCPRGRHPPSPICQRLADASPRSRDRRSPPREGWVPQGQHVQSARADLAYCVLTPGLD